MLTLTCLCGQIRVRTATRPDHVNACNCRFCSATGAWWGYFHPSEVTIEGRTIGYCRDDKPDPAAEAHFCGTCGTTTHFVLTPGIVARLGNGMMGVNMRLVDERELAGIELRYPDGRAWEGEGPFGHARAPRILGEPASEG